MAFAASSNLKTSNFEVPEEFICPICFKLPEEKIFQCRNGHIICQTCKQSLVICPQCRIDFQVDGSLIRNIALESYLETLPVECTFYKHGCQETVMRKDFKLHPSKFQLCHRLGYKCNCTFSGGDLEQLIDHLKNDIRAEQISLRKEDPTQLKISQFSVIECFARFRLNHIYKTSTELVWNPVLLRLYDGGIFLLVARYLREENAMTWTCCSLQPETESRKLYEVEFTLYSASKKMPDLRMSSTCLPVLDSEEMWNTPPIQFPVTLIRKHYMDLGSETLKMGIWIRKSRKPLNYQSFVEHTSFSEVTSLNSQNGQPYWDWIEIFVAISFFLAGFFHLWKNIVYRTEL